MSTLLKNTFIWLICSSIIYMTFYTNIKNEQLYYLYSIVTLLLFTTIVFLRKYFIHIKEISNYFSVTEKYLLTSGITFVIGLIALKIGLYILLNAIVIIGSCLFAVSFLKVLIFSIKSIKK